MNPSPELNTILKQLRLSGILDSLEQRNREAIHGKLAYTEFLAMLLHDEIASARHEEAGCASCPGRLRHGEWRSTYDAPPIPKPGSAIPGCSVPILF
jgi:hypothetical protein